MIPYTKYRKSINRVFSSIGFPNRSLGTRGEVTGITGNAGIEKGERAADTEIGIPRGKRTS
jgi:hypothetical protein